MFIELVDLLRCPRAHDDIWLVASITEMADRDIVAGTLGCPICYAEYPIAGGIVRFGQRPNTPSVPGDAGEAMRLAVALNLTDARHVAALQGRWGAHASQIATLVPAQLLLWNPAEDVEPASGVSIVIGDLRLASGSLSAVAVDDEAAMPMLIDALRAGGRILAPATCAVPDGIDELARDDEIWVGERARAGPIVQLSRGQRADT